MSEHTQLFIERNEYYPGDIINGRAVCQFNQSEDVTKIRIRFKGAESTKWTSGSGKSSTTYTGFNQFFCEDKIVYNNTNAGTMDAGQYIYQFTFVIPQNIPGSVKLLYGTVRYSIKLTVDKPWAFDYETKKEITILPLIKLENINSAFLEPSYFSDENTISCFCGTGGGHIQLDIQLARRALYIGEYFNFVLTCKNMSNVKVKAIKLYLNLKLTFTARAMFGDKKKCESTDIVGERYDGVDTYKETTSQLKFIIPVSSIPCFTGSVLLAVEPRLKFVVVTSGCHTNLKLKIPVAPYNTPRPDALLPTAPYDPSTLVDDQNGANMELLPPNYFSTTQESESLLSKLDQNDDMAPPPSYDMAIKNSTLRK